MTKKQNRVPVDGMVGLPPELQVDTVESTTPINTEAVETADKQSPEPELVVMTGNTVQHNGVIYHENSVIDIDGDDADRLIQMGVAVRLDDLKSRLLSRNTVTHLDGVKIQQGA